MESPGSTGWALHGSASPVAQNTIMTVLSLHTGIYLSTFPLNVTIIIRRKRTTTRIRNLHSRGLIT